MGSGALLATIGGGALAQVLLFALLVRLLKVRGKVAALVVGLLAVLIYTPYAIIHWPGVDVLAIHLAIYLTLAYGLGLIGSRVGSGWHWAPAVILAFFAGVIGINVIFVTVADKGITGLFSHLLPEPSGGEVADSRFPGTVSHDFQEKEALYNRYLEQVTEQHQRGWQVRYGWSSEPVLGQPAQFRVEVLDREGLPIEQAQIQGEFLRTSNSSDDFAFTMQELEPGEYSVDLDMPLHGLWKLVLSIRKGQAHHEIRATTSVKNAPSES